MAAAGRIFALAPTAIGITLGVDAQETTLIISRTDHARIDIHAVPIRWSSAGKSLSE